MRGDTVAVIINPFLVAPTGAYVDSWSYSGHGWQFKPSEDIRVTALGVYDGGPNNVSDGLLADYSVGLFTMDGTLLV